ncbi:hypothetical protein H6P81_006670 [Aristolochia fimbriata]|uniref:Secreted protein n=1 Tax=Aristolochia fimbriata TaxID=158543 RepID=A0AAV7F1N8_ARIFI|nr:hypothetical protein H6P81_006670 [Aristolochia fimbriata]
MGAIHLHIFLCAIHFFFFTSPLFLHNAFLLACGDYLPRQLPTTTASPPGWHSSPSHALLSRPPVSAGSSPGLQAPLPTPLWCNPVQHLAFSVGKIISRWLPVPDISSLTILGRFQIIPRILQMDFCWWRPHFLLGNTSFPSLTAVVASSSVGNHHSPFRRGSSFRWCGSHHSVKFVPMHFRAWRPHFGSPSTPSHSVGFVHHSGAVRPSFCCVAPHHPDRWWRHHSLGENASSFLG